MTAAATQTGNWARSPMDVKRFRQLRTRRYVAVFPALALPNVDDHAFAVDVLYPQTIKFASSHAGGVERHEDRACLQIARRRSAARLRPNSAGAVSGDACTWGTVWNRQAVAISNTRRNKKHTEQAEHRHILDADLDFGCGRD